MQLTNHVNQFYLGFLRLYYTRAQFFVQWTRINPLAIVSNWAFELLELENSTFPMRGRVMSAIPFWQFGLSVSAFTTRGKGGASWFVFCIECSEKTKRCSPSSSSTNHNRSSLYDNIDIPRTLNNIQNWMSPQNARLSAYEFEKYDTVAYNCLDKN